MISELTAHTPYLRKFLLQAGTDSGLASLLPEEETRTDTFIGTVEALRGDLDASGGRAGWVEFLLFNIVDNRPIRASAYLDATQYKVADEAHIAGAQEVAITGTLEPRPRVWYLRDIKGLRLAT